MTFFLHEPGHKAKNRHCSGWGGLLVAALLLFGGPAAAQGFSVNITVDENCNGSFTNTVGYSAALACALLTDPTSGGLPDAVTYSLLNPPGLTAGDVYLLEGGGGNPPVISDVLRFNPSETCSDKTTGCLVFYSDNTDGVDALADIGLPNNESGLPFITLPETGTEGSAQGATYTPVSGQPGFVAGAAGPVTYNLISDTVPEPATVALLGLGLAALGFSRRKQ